MDFSCPGAQHTKRSRYFFSEIKNESSSGHVSGRHRFRRQQPCYRLPWCSTEELLPPLWFHRVCQVRLWPAMPLLLHRHYFYAYPGIEWMASQISSFCRWYIRPIIAFRPSIIFWAFLRVMFLELISGNLRKRINQVLNSNSFYSIVVFRYPFPFPLPF